jgi:hypothetical protein
MTGPIDDPETTRVAQAIVAAFFANGAKNSATARTADELGIESGSVLDALIEDGIVRRVTAEPERLFIPFLSRSLFMPNSATKYSLIGFAIVVLMIILLAVFQR